MAFVYRYSTTAGTPRYVGMVKGDTMGDLLRRINEHSNETAFQNHIWIIEYIDNLTVTDAYLLEAHFIATHSETLFNIAKRNYGQITLTLNNLPLWKLLTEELKNRTYRTPKIFSLFPRKKIKSFICSNCGQSVESFPNIFEMKLASFEALSISNPRWLSLWLCDECRLEIDSEMEKISNRFLHHVKTGRFADEV